MVLGSMVFWKIVVYCWQIKLFLTYILLVVPESSAANSESNEVSNLHKCYCHSQNALKVYKMGAYGANDSKWC